LLKKAENKKWRAMREHILARRHIAN
jgi:hypothetical protein